MTELDRTQIDAIYARGAEDMRQVIMDWFNGCAETVADEVRKRAGTPQMDVYARVYDSFRDSAKSAGMCAIPRTCPSEMLRQLEERR